MQTSVRVSPAGARCWRLALLALCVLLSVASLPAQTVWQLFTETGSPSSFVGSNVGTGVTVAVPAGAAVTVYTSGFSPVDLAVGEKYNVSLSFSSSGGITGASTSNRIIGLGFFDSNGTASFMDDEGMMAWVRSDMSVELRQKNGTETVESLLRFGAYTFTNLGTGTGGTIAALANDTTYTVAAFQVDYTSSGYRFGTNTTTNPGVSIVGDSFSRQLYTNPGTIASGLTFDTFAVYFWNTSGSTAEFSIGNVSLATAAIPEPSTYAALLGVVALGGAMWRRRRGA